MNNATKLIQDAASNPINPFYLADEQFEKSSYYYTPGSALNYASFAIKPYNMLQILRTWPEDTTTTGMAPEEISPFKLAFGAKVYSVWDWNHYIPRHHVSTDVMACIVGQPEKDCPCLSKESIPISDSDGLKLAYYSLASELKSICASIVNDYLKGIDDVFTIAIPLDKGTEYAINSLGLIVEHIFSYEMTTLLQNQESSEFTGIYNWTDYSIEYPALYSTDILPESFMGTDRTVNNVERFHLFGYKLKNTNLRINIAFNWSDSRRLASDSGVGDIILDSITMRGKIPEDYCYANLYSGVPTPAMGGMLDESGVRAMYSLMTELEAHYKSNVDPVTLPGDPSPADHEISKLRALYPQARTTLYTLDAFMLSKLLVMVDVVIPEKKDAITERMRNFIRWGFPFGHNFTFEDLVTREEYIAIFNGIMYPMNVAFPPKLIEYLKGNATLASVLSVDIYACYGCFTDYLAKAIKTCRRLNFRHFNRSNLFRYNMSCNVYSDTSYLIAPKKRRFLVP